MAVNASYEKYDKQLNGVTPKATPDEKGIDNNARTTALGSIILAARDTRNSKALIQAAMMDLPESDPVWAYRKRGAAPSIVEDRRGYVLAKALEAFAEGNWLEREKLLNYAIAQLPQDDPALNV